MPPVRPIIKIEIPNLEWFPILSGWSWEFDRGYDQQMEKKSKYISVTFVQPDGMRESYEGIVGDHLMDVAVDNGVRGIIGQCGGGCTCCTCHVWVDPQWQERAKGASGDERELLSYALGVNERSRLACQIQLTQELDGIVVEVPS
ncbi:MAG: 2Fe-2S iron-sulfur cluster-binding protein, partial [Pseudomonadota bacterium]|nr:2Fe-2S iron-sulfur cluster-binding protein [Pseudomonadota bacterium]